MEEKALRPLHLHTLDSLCADLINGHAVGIGQQNTPFILTSVAARSVLNWYYYHKAKWAGNAYAADIEAIVDSVAHPPTAIPESAQSSLHAKPRYTLLSIKAHQFGGLHHASSGAGKPGDFYFEFGVGPTMFEGFNGSGKTSILNAIIWALTGDILRPQRPPEAGSKDFVFEIDGAGPHSAPPVAPLPDLAVEKPAAAAISVDTWVELIFEDDTKARNTVRRSLKRNARGVLKEELTGLDRMALDPVGARVGTTMPGLLPFIQVGSESKLGKAVAELTGMAPLVQLSSHAERAKKKIEGDLIKERNEEINALDTAYLRSHIDLQALVAEHPSLMDGNSIPLPSADPEIEIKLSGILTYFDTLKARGLLDAKDVLGERFNSEDESQRVDLMASIQPAFAAIKGLKGLASTTRLNALSKLTEAEIATVRQRIADVNEEAKALVEIAAEPGRAARVRLYSRVAAWMKEHDSILEYENSCVICGHDLQDVLDPITQTSIKTHLKDASSSAGDFLGKTFSTWAQHVLGELSRDLPQVLALELKAELPSHPGVLIRQAVVDELFEDDAFASTLGLLKTDLEKNCDATIATFPQFVPSPHEPLGDDRKELTALNTGLRRIQNALDFSAWRNANQDALANFMKNVVGLPSTAERGTELGSLMGRLQRLEAMVAAVEPVNEGTKLCNRMVTDIGNRRIKERRVRSYEIASSALHECSKVGSLAEQQVEQLQRQLHRSTVLWRNLIYSSAFPSTSLELVDTKMNGDGELQLMIGAAGLAAPAQHVANASALRASLVGFFLAYWEYMLKERGGLRLLLLDDPQELLDGDNRDRLADSIEHIVKSNAQLIITTHDARFAATVARRSQPTKIKLNHQYVHPANSRRGTIYLSPSIAKVQAAYDAYVADPDDAANAQDYAAECRIFIEGRMGDMFDDAAFPTASTVNFAPTLSDHIQRLRGLIKGSSNELFRSPVLAAFVNDSALKDKSPALSLLNKAHHKDKVNIRPKDVFSVLEDLERLRRHAERAHEEFRLFRRRSPLVPPVKELALLEANAIPAFRVPILPSLTAFVRDASVGESQETEFEEITSDWFKEKVFFYVRADNYGFAGLASSIAIVEAESESVEDRSLVIARRGKEIYARRLLRPSDSEMVALAAETPDPRKSPRTLLIHENTVSLHRVVGMMFNGQLVPPESKKEAVQIDAAGLLPKVKFAYRIKEESAVPLALPGQIALGGSQISLSEFDANIDAYVALHLDDGSSIFKRVGEKLPAPLSHLRRFETIGGLGIADVLAIGQPQPGFRRVTQAVSVIGVLYRLESS